MKTSTASRVTRTNLLCASILCFWPLAGRASSPETVYRFTLVEGGQLVDDCPICDRIPIVVPMRGTFELRLLEQNPLFTTYAVENIDFTAGNSSGFAYKIVGNGTYRFGGEVIYQRDLELDLLIHNGAGWDQCRFTNSSPNIIRPWPMLQVGVDQTNGTMVQQYHLDLNAAPFRELWFSTAKAFTAGNWNPPTNAISDGALLSSAGRIVKSNYELSAHLGIMPLVPDLGLKGIDILPGGEVAFSVEREVFSESFGALGAGDLLGSNGRVILRNQELLAAFPPQPPFPPDIGLAAVQVASDGEVFFSVQKEYFAEQPGVTIHPGDLLARSGKILRTGGELLSAFKLENPELDYGLTAVYVWPTNEISGIGEIWFATRDGFSDAKGQQYAGGDLLSDQGYVVYRNEELLGSFTPTVPGSLGLDALFIVTDVTASPPASLVGAPQITTEPPSSLTLEWEGSGRVFQVERAWDVRGPYAPASPLMPDRRFVDTGAFANSSAAFYRVRQW